MSVAGIVPSAPVVSMQQYFCAKYGITDANFAFWLRDADNYGEVFRFLIQGAVDMALPMANGSHSSRKNIISNSGSDVSNPSTS